ncbi:hypothetical protein XENORESO_019295 [Xenotaenia resolanae]|uniref:Uncharacterized protein n=1 Tax=Xenotaenia resolanae TaxID=208358 RepID=A0ABV0X3L3_9TELE
MEKPPLAIVQYGGGSVMLWVCFSYKVSRSRVSSWYPELVEIPGDLINNLCQGTENRSITGTLSRMIQNMRPNQHKNTKRHIIKRRSISIIGVKLKNEGSTNLKVSFVLLVVSYFIMNSLMTMN